VRFVRSFIIVVHEWENDKRENPATKRKITRPPHADEIVKRRQAGTSIRQLAADFWMCMGGMANVIGNRL
jgi:hypothetical protein